jgi:transcriptional regulator GlxA family with amidase domain
MSWIFLLRLNFYAIYLTICAMNIFISSADKLRVTLLVLPDSSMMSLASALDTMRAANRIANRDLFTWNIATINGKSARLTCDLVVEPDITLDAQSSGDVLIIIAGFNQQYHAGPAHLKLIKRLSRNFSAVGGIEAGSWILARSGLLENRSATTHWEDLEEFATHFPRVNLKPDRFVIDGSVFYDGVHSATDTQPLVSLGMLENNEPRVAAAIHVMEQYIDEPISVKTISAQVKISVRMLEYLFRQTLDMSPAAYYRRLRLQTARRMVVDTRLKLQEIAVRTGFNSLSSFSRLFKHYYQQSPGECRRQAQGIT